MSIKNAFKKLLVIFFISFFVLLLGATFAWRLLNTNSLKNKIKNVDINKELSINFKNLNIKKSFPYLIIQAQSIHIRSNSINISANFVENKVSILKYLYAYLLKKQYYGKVKAKNIKIEINNKQTSKKSDTIPIIPLDIQTNNIDIRYNNNTANGKIKLTYTPLTNKYKILFNGKINKVKTDINGLVGKNNITAIFSYDIRNIGEIKLNSIKGKASLSNFQNILFTISTNKIIYKTLTIDSPEIKGRAKITKNSISIKNIFLMSKNGYNLEINGRVDKNNLLKSSLKGHISTPFINIQPIIKQFAPNTIKDYILQSHISLKHISFEGNPSLEFIRSGVLLVKNSRFRLDKKSSSFFIKKAKAKISKQSIDIIASGNFEDITFKDSKMQIHRTKGYPCDMDLSYQGNANDLVRVFLEENIFSDSDLKVFGKSKKLKGNFAATTVIRDYRWGPKPYFFFDINIHSNGLEIFNENIPSRYVKSWGDIQIRRNIEYKQIKNLFIRFKNLKLYGLTSKLYTQDTILYIQPKIKFKGKFKADLSKDDFNYLEKAIIGEQFIKSKVEVGLLGSLDGYIDNFKFKGKILSDTKMLSQTPKDALKIKTAGFYKKHILHISKLNINKNLNANGTVNTKLFSFNTNISLNNFSISSLNGLMESRYILLKNGILKGKIHVNGNKQNPIQTIQGNISVQNGYYSKDINSINASIEFDNKKAYIKHANLHILNNNINAKGFVDFMDYAIFDITADTFNLNIKDLQGKTTNKTTIKIPNMDINITAKTNKIILKNKNNTQTSKNLIITLRKRKNGIAALNILSKDTRMLFLKKQNHITIDIKDYIIMPLLTNNNRKDNMLSIQADLIADNKSVISLEHLKGDINVQSINGKFKNVSDTLKLLSATNIIEIIIGKTKLDNNIEYNKIVANLFIKNGIIRTKNNSIAALYGKNLNIFAQGSYNITQNYINAYITFTTFRSINTLISYIPVMGWIVGGKERSFSGVSLRVNGYIDKKVKISAVPLESLGKGFLNMLKRTITLPFNAFGVAK